jgi:hypothetical protein
MGEMSNIIVYDVRALPFNLPAQDMVEIKNNTGFVFYDSSEGNEPKIDKVDEDDSIRFINTSTDEGKELFNKIYGGDHE